MQPPLWLSESRRQKIVSGESQFAKRIARVAEGDAVEERWPDRAMQLAFSGLLENNSYYAWEAAVAFSNGLRSMPDSWDDPGKARACLAAAVVFDAVGNLWEADTLTLWQYDAAQLLSRFYHISPSKPHDITGACWAVTHSALYCLAAALRSSGMENIHGLRPLSEIEEWAWLRLEAFLGHFGDRGAYHECLGYQDYTSAFLLPALLAREARSGESLKDALPGLSHMASTLFCSAIAGPFLNDSTGGREGWGRQLSWNDAGLGWPESSVAMLAIQLADPEDRPLLYRQWNRLSGLDRPQACPATNDGARFFHLTYHPDDLPKGGNPLPLSVCDRKQGLWFSRNAYEGRQDAVLGAYARCHHPGGSSRHDAGSFRFSACGWDWVLGGAQALREAMWQSVVTSGQPTQKLACGSVIWAEERVFGMDLRNVHETSSERYLAFHPASPVAVAVLDIIDDHRNDRAWTWNMTFSPELHYVPGDSGFQLQAPDGTILAVRFLGTLPASLRVEWSPACSRTLLSGEKREYISRPCVRAEFSIQSPLNVYTVLTVHPAEQALPAVTLSAGLDLHWGELSWPRPFGFALPPDAVPGTISGQCTHLT